MAKLNGLWVGTAISKTSSPFPFLARCIARRVTSPLKVGDEVEVLKMAPDEECEREMFVVVRWEGEGLAVPLSQSWRSSTPAMKPKKPSRIGSTGAEKATGSEAYRDKEISRANNIVGSRVQESPRCVSAPR
jgi:Calcium binding